MAKLLTVLKSNRHGHRDWLIALLIYRHGLRVSEACDLRWDDIDLAKRTVQVRRLKGSTDSVHYLERDELAGLKRLQREQEPKAANPTGKRIIKYRTFKRTKKEAKAELVRLINSAHQGDYVDPSKTTVSEFAGRWLRNWAAINVGAKTLERYEELISAHVRPYIGAVPIQKLQPVHLAELYAKLLREGNRQRGLSKVTGLSPRTVGHVHRALHKALKVAVEWGVVQRNAAAVARPPKVEGAELEILAEEQAQTLLQKLKGQPLYPIVVLGLATGMRRGELLALRWCDVDLDGRKLRVEHSLEQTKVGGLRPKPPKTRHGRRTISLAPSVVAELRTHWKQQQEQRLRLGLGKAPEDALVFPKWDGTPRVPTTTSTEWTRILAQLKLPTVSLHALRHTHASQLIASGMDVLTISRRLGHGSPTSPSKSMATSSVAPTTELPM
jgi:integrase